MVLQCVYWLLLEPHTYVRECVCERVCARLFYLKSYLEEVRNTWQHQHWKSPAFGHSSVCACVCLCLCVYTNVSILIGNGPFECIGAGMGSVCGRYFVHLSKMVILGSRKLLTMRTQPVPSLHQCHNLLGCFKRALAAK